MNKYIFVLIVCAVVFLICFLIDTLFKVIFPKSKLEKSKQVVRPPRKSAVAGVILTFAGVAVLIKNLAGTPDTLFLIGSIVAIIFGVILLCTLAGGYRFCDLTKMIRCFYSTSFAGFNIS